MIVLGALEVLIHAKWADKKDDRYYAAERALDFGEIGNDLGFREAFVESCKQMIKKIDLIAQEDTNLIFFSAIPLDPSRLLELKTKIRTAVLDIFDEFQNDEGTVIKKVMMGIY